VVREVGDARAFFIGRDGGVEGDDGAGGFFACDEREGGFVEARAEVTLRRGGG
jgi:hypothetical protein